MFKNMLWIIEVLRKKLNQKEIKYIIKIIYKGVHINFVILKRNYNYSKKNHFVIRSLFHNMVSHDLTILINYIDSNEFKNINKNESLKEI